MVATRRRSELVDAGMSVVLGPELRALVQGASALLAWLCVKLQARGRELGVDRVLFMTREGLLFKAYYERFWASSGSAPSAELLRVSRLSTFAASLHGQDVASLDRLFTQYPETGWSQLLASLGERDSPLHVKPVGTGRALGRAIAKDPVLTAWLMDVAARKHAELSAYLHAQHADALRFGHVLVVDIGWRGTIQDNLALACPQVQWDGVYVGLYPFMNPQPPNGRKRGLLFGPSSVDRVEGGNLMPIEYLFHQPVGTVAGYRGGEAFTLTSASREDAFSAAFQSAVLSDAEHRAAKWAQQGESALITGWQQEAIDFWSSCQRMPLELFLALARYAHEETFGLGRAVNMAAAMSPQAALRSLVSRRERALFLQYVSALPLRLRHEAGVGLWLRAWLHLRHVLQWLRSHPRT